MALCNARGFSSVEDIFVKKLSPADMRQGCGRVGGFLFLGNRWRAGFICHARTDLERAPNTRYEISTSCANLNHSYHMHSLWWNPPLQTRCYGRSPALLVQGL
jgi:hypothetical protein